MRKSFWRGLPGKIGGPIFSASLVGCLIMHHHEPLHWILMSTGLGLMVLDHWWNPPQ